MTAERRPDLVDLFERRGPRGGPKLAPAYGCWCMYWRDRSLPHGEPKKEALRGLVEAGRELGLLAYADDVPIGWVSIAPRDELPHLLRSPQYRPRDEGGGVAVWSLVCFAVDPDHRGRGVAEALLDDAVAHAFACGATSVEAYPHVTRGDDYMGGVDLYRVAGFAHVRPANKRAVVRVDAPRGGRQAARSGHARGQSADMSFATISQLLQPERARRQRVPVPSDACLAGLASRSPAPSTTSRRGRPTTSSCSSTRSIAARSSISC